jgi:hypothetical protein
MGRSRGHQEAVLVEPRFGIYGTCGGCGADVLYYSDFDVKCSNCHRLYGTWSIRRPRTQQEILEERAMRKRSQHAENNLVDLQ